VIKNLLFVLAVTTMVILAQDTAGPGPARQGGAPPPRNLKVLKPEEVNARMQQMSPALGVQCNECHVADRASDENPSKITAREMFRMTAEINARFPDGKAHVTCYTCHRGKKAPLTARPEAASPAPQG
jgi:hypothetical protein